MNNLSKKVLLLAALVTVPMVYTPKVAAEWPRVATGIGVVRVGSGHYTPVEITRPMTFLEFNAYIVTPTKTAGAPLGGWLTVGNTLRAGIYAATCACMLKLMHQDQQRILKEAEKADINKKAQAANREMLQQERAHAMAQPKNKAMRDLEHKVTSIDPIAVTMFREKGMSDYAIKKQLETIKANPRLNGALERVKDKRREAYAERYMKIEQPLVNRTQESEKTKNIIVLADQSNGYGHGAF